MQPMTAPESYDYVIVGAGSAGCAVAGRLSENPSVRVAVIEAGPPAKGRLFEVPALFSRQLKTAFDWDFSTEPEPAPTSQIVRPGPGPRRARTRARTSALVIMESRWANASSGSAQASGAPWWPANDARVVPRSITPAPWQFSSWRSERCLR